MTSGPQNSAKVPPISWISWYNPYIWTIPCLYSIYWCHKCSGPCEWAYYWVSSYHMHVGWLSGPSTTDNFFPKPLLPPSKFPGPFLWRVDGDKGAILPHPTSGGEVMDGKVVWVGEWAVVVRKSTWALVFWAQWTHPTPNNPSLDECRWGSSPLAWVFDLWRSCYGPQRVWHVGSSCLLPHKQGPRPIFDPDAHEISNQTSLTKPQACPKDWCWAIRQHLGPSGSVNTGQKVILRLTRLCQKSENRPFDMDIHAYQKMAELKNVPIAHTNSAKVSIWIVMTGRLSSPQKTRFWLLWAIFHHWPTFWGAFHLNEDELCNQTSLTKPQTYPKDWFWAIGQHLGLSGSVDTGQRADFGPWKWPKKSTSRPFWSQCGQIFEHCLTNNLSPSPITTMPQCRNWVFGIRSSPYDPKTAFWPFSGPKITSRPFWPPCRPQIPLRKQTFVLNTHTGNVKHLKGGQTCNKSSWSKKSDIKAGCCIYVAWCMLAHMMSTGTANEWKIWHKKCMDDGRWWTGYAVRVACCSGTNQGKRQCCAILRASLDDIQWVK